LLRAPFWRSVRERLAAPAATVLINTLYHDREEHERLEADLRAAGWRDVQQRVDRGLQALPGQRRRGLKPSEWRPNDNMIFSARC